ncbi:MAG: type I-B CRISPR-associated protein Cas7/Cst2/DevR [Armatimonadota bacterium]|nr:type I-B CRISPR-associated protein Cas7/Cst2/DevR [Armatimonadota bacterium]
MANPILTAAVLIEANGAALNNSGEPIERARTDNTVSVKAIRIGKYRYPYVSGQAWRRWWRETLYEDYGWKPSPVTREAKSAYTAGDPISYADDDIFGYMAAKKEGTQRRVSPLKNSLLISVLPNTVEQDFAHFSRNLPRDNSDPVPFEFEHYSTYLQGVFSLSLTDAGRFEIGKMRDLHENFSDTGATIINDQPTANGIRIALLPMNERKKRIAECIKALAMLRHGANLTRNLSDVAPVAVIIGFLDGGNAPFQRVFMPTDDNSGVQVDIDRLTTVLADYKDRLLPVSSPVIFGAIPGILSNEEKVNGLDGVTYAGSAVDAILKAAEIIENDDQLPNIWS